MRTTRKTAPIVIATVLALGVVGLTSCTRSSSSPASPSASSGPKATAKQPPPSSTAVTPTPSALPRGSIPVAGYQPAAVAEVVNFVEQFARAAMSGCGPQALRALEPSMTPALYAASVKSTTPIVLTFEPPTIMSPKCVTSQTLSGGTVAAGPVVKHVPSIRVAVTVAEGLKVSTTTNPKTFKSITATRRYTVDVLPFGKNWQVTNVITSQSKVTVGK